MGSLTLRLLRKFLASAAARLGWTVPGVGVLCMALASQGQTMKSPDVRQTPTLYVVPYAHLDTQWRWEFPQTISEFLLKTMRVNFDYIDKYPDYVFNWTGSNRYRLMKEYFPDDYQRMKQYVAAGPWFPAGSSVEEGDMNLPSAEGIFRQVLYGNEYYRHEFGKSSTEFLLPDCFGFPASLPSILAASGLKGFSTQKLNSIWQPGPRVGGPGSPEQTPEGIPFNVGVWVGPDGKSVVAALNPEKYISRVSTDLSQPLPAAWIPTPEERAKMSAFHLLELELNWVSRIQLDGAVSGIYADYHYVGTGDTGGGPTEDSIRILEATVTKGQILLTPPVFPGAPAHSPGEEKGTVERMGEGPVRVVISTADQMFNAITPDMTSRMPRYQGDLELINHSAGSLTSEAYHKRWYTKNELLADAAEKSSVAALWLGARTYPQQRLNDAWELNLAGDFHDTAAGTATPRAYQFAWNDNVIAANQFSGILASASEAVASGLDTRVKGVPVVVFNPLGIAREDIVQASVEFPGGMPHAVQVFGPDGKEAPSQLQDGKVLFLAKVESVGYAVYDIRPAKAETHYSLLSVTPSSLENARYRVTVNKNGDVSSIFDKLLNRELLTAPLRFALSNDSPQEYPAWNMDFDQEQALPRAYVSGPAKIRIAEHGPARVALEIARETKGSSFTQTIRLSAGDAGNRVEFGNVIDWRTLDANLKATFALTASNQNATYNWDVGTILRPTANQRQFEVASHRWIDLTDKSNSFGVTVLTDCKNGSDKPDKHTLRLTLLRTPGISQGQNPHNYDDQANQDWGHHEFVFGLASHAGGWRDGQTDWQAYRLSDPLVAFEATRHPGVLGKRFSLLKVEDPRIRVLAMKKAEDSDELIIRLVELDGTTHPNVRVSFAAPIVAAREVNAQEQPVGPATIHDGDLTASFTAYQTRTFAIRLAPVGTPLPKVHSEPVALHYDLAVATDDDTRTPRGGFDGRGDALPAEMLPREINYHDVRFQLASAHTGIPNAVVAHGQKINLPAGPYNRVYILAASADGDRRDSFYLGNRSMTLNIEDWGGFIGQWDTRIWGKKPQIDWAISAHHAVWPPANMAERERISPVLHFPDDYIGLKAGYIKPAGLAWYASHHHTPDGLNQPYQYSYLFAYMLPIPRGQRVLKLPDDNKVRVLAVSVAEEAPELKAAQPLFDNLGRTEPPDRLEARQSSEVPPKGDSR